MKKILLTPLLVCIQVSLLYTQTQYSTPFSPGGQEFAPRAADFLTIPTSAVMSGMGYTGISTEPGPSNIHVNPAPLSLSSAHTYLELSFTPWQRNLVAEMSLTSLAAYTKINEKNTLGATVQYFSQGTILTTTSAGGLIQKRFYDVSIGMAWSRKINKNLSYGLGMKYVNASVFPFSSMDFDPERTNTMAADLGMYYRDKFSTKEKSLPFALGISISNLGPKFHLDEHVELYLPTLLRLGGSLQYPAWENHGFIFSIEAHKLLVPTQPRYATVDSLALTGKDPGVNFLKGVFQSFSDAPGISPTDDSYNTLKEELQEIMASAGIEYGYKEQYFFRTGYFYQHAEKGNNGFVSFGAGYDLGGSRLNVSYILPINNESFKNTWQLSFAIKMNKKE